MVDVVDVRLRPASQPISLTVRAGEILGSRASRARARSTSPPRCAGSTPAEGRVVVRSGGTETPVGGFRHAMRNGIAYVPRERKREGLFFSLSTLDNFSVPMLRTQSRLGFLRWGRIRARFREEAARLRLTYRHESDLVGTLSGGNQQKVLLGRWLTTSPRVLVLNDPLRGVDANTKEELYELFRQLADEGLAIVFVSTEILELLVACDRIGVFHAGRLEALLDAGEASETAVVAAMFGHGGAEREEAAQEGGARELANRSSYAVAPTLVAVVLFVANVIAQPEFVSSNVTTTLAVATPFIITAMAQALPLLSGNGGLDLSIGPFMSFTTVMIAGKFASTASATRGPAADRPRHGLRLRRGQRRPHRLPAAAADHRDPRDVPLLRRPQRGDPARSGRRRLRRG